MILKTFFAFLFQIKGVYFSGMKIWSYHVYQITKNLVKSLRAHFQPQAGVCLFPELHVEKTFCNLLHSTNISDS